MCISWSSSFVNINPSITAKSIPGKLMFVLTRISGDQLFVFRVIARAEQTEDLMKASKSQSQVSIAAQRKSCKLAAMEKKKKKESEEIGKGGPRMPSCPAVAVLSVPNSPLAETYR